MMKEKPKKILIKAADMEGIDQLISGLGCIITVDGRIQFFCANAGFLFYKIPVYKIASLDSLAKL